MLEVAEANGFRPVVDPAGWLALDGADEAQNLEVIGRLLLTLAHGKANLRFALTRSEPAATVLRGDLVGVIGDLVSEAGAQRLTGERKHVLAALLEAGVLRALDDLNKKYVESKTTRLTKTFLI